MTVQSWTEMLQLHPILLLLDTFLKLFLELKLYIPYVVLKLRKSRVQCFKRYVIWIWNEEVMAIWKNPISHLGGWIVPCAKFSHNTSPYAKFAQHIPLCEIFAPPLPCANFWASSSLPSPIPSLWASFLCFIMPKTRGGYASAPQSSQRAPRTLGSHTWSLSLHLWPP